MWYLFRGFSSVQLLSHVRLFATLWTVAHQSMGILLWPLGFSRPEYWSGLPCPPPGDLSNPGIKPKSLVSPALTDGFFTTSITWEAPHPSHPESFPKQM